MKTSPTPKYRPSYSLEQLHAIKQAIEFYEVHNQTIPLGMLEVATSIRVFLAKIGEGIKSPAYETKATPAMVKVTAAMLGEVSPESQVKPAITLEEVKRYAKIYATTHLPFLEQGMQLEIDANMQEAWEAWQTYCTENDLDPVKEAKED